MQQTDPGHRVSRRRALGVPYATGHRLVQRGLARLRARRSPAGSPLPAA
jgi:hypothetical protein